MRVHVTINDLLQLGLRPQEFMAACFILTRSDHDLAVVRTSDIAAAVGLTTRQSQRLVQGLIEIGFLTRIERGIYRVHLPQQQTPMSEGKDTDVAERTLVSVSVPVYKPKTNDLASKTPNGVLLGGSAPLKGYKILKGTTLRGISDGDNDGDDLGNIGYFGLSIDPPRKRRRKRNSPPQFHRVVPRAEWDMYYVAKEFRHRLRPYAQRLNLIGGGGGKKLPVILRKWEADYGLTPEQAATLCDDFFADEQETARISGKVEAFQQWLQYIKRNLARVQAGQITDEDIARVEAQEIPF